MQGCFIVTGKEKINTGSVDFASFVKGREISLPVRAIRGLTGPLGALQGHYRGFMQSIKLKVMALQNLLKYKKDNEE